MKKYLIIALAVSFSIYLFGCGKKQAVLEPQEQMSMDVLSAMSPETQAPAEVKVSEPKVELTGPVPLGTVRLEQLPPAGPYKPTAQEIQLALKNAGFYAEEVDGKIGPKTKKAIQEFQAANGLEADGKVGPKTWAVLSPYLSSQAETPVAGAGKKSKRR